MDAQSDSKSLLGTYVVGSTPGEFNWTPGALTQAVRECRWVVIEDVDQAPFEVLAALIPLLEERKLYIPGRGESIGAHEGFQLFGTATTGAGRAGGLGAAGGAAAVLLGDDTLVWLLADAAVARTLRRLRAGRGSGPWCMGRRSRENEKPRVGQVRQSTRGSSGGGWG